MGVTSGDTSSWFAVRCIVRFAETADRPALFEERITLWRDTTMEAAIERAEAEVLEFAANTDGEALGFAQAYALLDAPGDGQEVFSLMRDSELGNDDYLDRFFDTGKERQQTSAE